MSQSEPFHRTIVRHRKPSRPFLVRRTTSDERDENVWWSGWRRQRRSNYSWSWTEHPWLHASIHSCTPNRRSVVIVKLINYRLGTRQSIAYITHTGHSIAFLYFVTLWPWHLDEYYSNLVTSSSSNPRHLWHTVNKLSLIHIWRCRRSTLCRSRWSPYH